MFLSQDEYRNLKFDRPKDDLYIGDFHIMRHDERGYMEKSVDEICKRINPKVVLEVGYGFGYSARQFDKHNLTKHYVVEPHPEVLAIADKDGWANGKDRVLIRDFIQNVHLDGRIDLIYDDSEDFVGGLGWPSFWNRYEWAYYAIMPLLVPPPLRDQFSFEFEGKTYYQIFEKNLTYSAFYGDRS